MILTGPEIIAAIHRGDIDCTPFVEAHVGPASLDLTLSDELLTYRNMPGTAQAVALDIKAEPVTKSWEIPAEGFTLWPGVVYLGSTVEVVGVGGCAGVVAARSSVARLGVCVETAGFIDPFFRGQITLEISVVQPVVIHSGFRVAQLVFHRTVGRPSEYRGRYQDQRGPQPSRLWRDFLPASTP